MPDRERLTFDTNPDDLSEIDRRQLELTSLAIDRVETALKSVTQLQEGGHEVYALLLSVAGTILRSAAIVRLAGHKATGKPVTIDTAEKAAMLDLLVGLGMASLDDLERKRGE